MYSVIFKSNGLAAKLFPLGRSVSQACWSCDRKISAIEAKNFFCPCERRILLPVNSAATYFDLLGVDANYTIIKKDLTHKFRQLMRRLHPDLFTLKSTQEKDFSADHSSRLNKAYSTLINPIERATYMLRLKGVDYEGEAHIARTTEDPAEVQRIIVEVMELNEFIDEIEKPSQVADLESRLDKLIEPLEAQMGKALSVNDLSRTIGLLAKMKYYQNVSERLTELKYKFQMD